MMSDQMWLRNFDDVDDLIWWGDILKKWRSFRFEGVLNFSLSFHLLFAPIRQWLKPPMGHWTKKSHSLEQNLLAFSRERKNSLSISS